MAQVPYSSVPSVEARQTPIGPERIEANPDMFGASVGRAISQFGSVTSEAGNEVFARAQAMQQMKNEADANNASAQYDIQAGQLHAQFSAQTGANAGPQALASHEQNLQDLRTQIAGTLDNPAAQKLYNNASLSTMGRTIFNAAGHSAEQTKSYYESGLQAKVQQSIDGAAANPGDELAFKANLAAIPDTMRNLGASQGWSPDVLQEKTQEATSKLYGQRITGLSRQNPQAGQQAFDAAIADGSLRGQDIAGVQRTVDAQTLSGGAKQAVDSVNDGSGMLMGKGPVDIGRAADAIANIESSGNYQARGKPTANGDQALGKYQVMPANLPSWLQDSGLPAMTPAQFLANPAAQDKVFQTEFGKLMQKYGNANDAASAWLTGKPMAQAGNAADANGSTAQSYVSKFNAALAQGASTQEKVAVLQAHAAEVAPNLALFPDALKERMIQSDREQQAMQQQAQRQTQNTLDAALANTQGKTPTSFDAFVNLTPELSQAYHGLDGKKQLSFQQSYRTAMAGDNVPSPERDAARNQMIGLAQNDPETFLDKNLYGTNLTASDRKVLVQQRDTMLKGATQDSHLNVAMGVLQTQMNAAGLSRASDKDGYDTFTGALGNEMRVFQGQHQRQPNANEIKDIGNRLLTSPVSQPGMLWGTNSTNLYQAQPPQAYTDNMKKQYPTASDDQIRQRFVRDQYRIAVGKEANAQH